MHGTPGGATIVLVGVEAFTHGQPPWPMQLLLLVAALVSLFVWHRLTGSADRLGRRLRSRLLLGVPWGTLLVGLFLLCVFLFVQSAYSGDIFDPRQPVTYAFTAWSYQYPLGVLTAAFSHTGFNHLFGNVVSFLVFGSIAEYGARHFPTERGTQAFRSPMTNPFGRILTFVGVVLVVGLLTAAFSPAKIIGFSGVVYAAAGFALIVRPLTTIGGILLVDFLSNLYNTFSNPVSTWAPGTHFVSVWFADIAVLGHLLGFGIGVVLGVWILRRREATPAVSRLWAGTILFGLLQGLWLAYLPLGNGRYRLYRAVGAAFIFLAAAVVVVAAEGPTRPLLPWPDAFSGDLRDAMPSRGQTATLLLFTALVALAGAGVVVHLGSVGTTELPNNPVRVRDYQIGYSENVTNQIYSVVDVPYLEQETKIPASGVIVYNRKRNVWSVAASTSQLKSNGAARVVVGGVGWRETVVATRTGWSVVGGDQTYHVLLYPPGGNPHLAYTADPATAEAIIANRTVTIRAKRRRFDIALGTGNETVGVVGMPNAGANATLGDFRFERRGRKLYVSHNGTIIRIAKKVVPPVRKN